MRYAALGLVVGAWIVSACGGDDTSKSAGADPTVDAGPGSGGDGGGGGGGTDGSTGSTGTDGGPIDTGPGHPASVPPTKTCAYTPDKDGFFMLTSPKGDYWVRLPKGYDKTKPTPVVMGMHGCGDTAANFVTWAGAPYNDASNAVQNDVQSYIAIAVEDVANQCWDSKDSDKVLAALDDASACFYVDQAHVTIAGYSSGASVAYLVGLQNAQRFSGILIEDGALYDNGSLEPTLLANAAWKINIAHMAHNMDTDYPLAMVQADWAKIKAAGFPLTTSSVDGSHDGTYTDWSTFLIPKVTGWTAP